MAYLCLRLRAKAGCREEWSIVVASPAQTGSIGWLDEAVAEEVGD